MKKDLSPFIVSVVELMSSTDGISQGIKLKGEIGDFEDIILANPVVVTGLLTKAGDMLEGKFQAEVQLKRICDRCAKEFLKSLNLNIIRYFDHGPDSEKISKDDTIDLEPIIKEEIILSLPIKELCSEDCQGVDNATA